MKTKLVSLLGILLLVVVVVACAAPAQTPAPSTEPTPQPTTQKTWDLKYATQNMPTSYYVKYADEPWAQDVEKATNGAVKITVYPANSLVKAQDAWEATKSGVTDIAWIFPGYYPGQFAPLDSINLPFIAPNVHAASKVVWDLYQKYPEIQALFDDVQVLSMWSSEPFYLVDSEMNFKTLDDFKGRRLRMSGGPPTETAKALGAVPTSIAMPDTYLQIQKGVIDGLAACTEPYLSFNLYEVAPYITYAPITCPYFILIMNKKVWNDMPADVQQQVMSVSGEVLAERVNTDVFDRAYSEMPGVIKNAGYEVYEYTPPSSELDKWIDVAGKPVWDAWVKQLQEKGYNNAQNILDDTLAIVKDYNNK